MGKTLAIPRGVRLNRNDFSQLQGQVIGVNQAADKYDVPGPTISRWVKKGFIRVLGSRLVPGGFQKLLDESDVAYCVAVYKTDPGQGKWFDPTK